MIRVPWPHDHPAPVVAGSPVSAAGAGRLLLPPVVVTLAVATALALIPAPTGTGFARFQAPPPAAARAPTRASVGVLSGMVVNGAIRIPVWIGARPGGPRVAATAIVDTGAVPTMVDQECVQAAGVSAVPTRRAVYGGSWGTVTVGFYGPLYVWPRTGGPPLLRRAVEPGGLAGTVFAAEGVAVLMGQDAPAHWHLVQARTRWTLRYTPAGRGAARADKTARPGRGRAVPAWPTLTGSASRVRRASRWTPPSRLRASATRGGPAETPG